jgi:hypothetical protein
MEKARFTVAAWRASKVTASAPTAPRVLAASPDSDDGITLRWADNSDNEEGFKVERSRDGVNWEEIALLGPNVTRFSDTGLDSNGEYSYRVSAFNGVAESSSSEVVTTTLRAESSADKERIQNRFFRFGRGI